MFVLVASAPIYAFQEFFHQQSTQYFLHATGYFLTIPLSKHCSVVTERNESCLNEILQNKIRLAGGQCTYSCFPGVISPATQQYSLHATGNFLTKPSSKHCSVARERNESCLNVILQSKVRLAIGRCTYSPLPGVLSPAIHKRVFACYSLLSDITIVET